MARQAHHLACILRTLRIHVNSPLRNATATATGIATGNGNGNGNATTPAPRGLLQHPVKSTLNPHKRQPCQFKQWSWLSRLSFRLSFRLRCTCLHLHHRHHPRSILPERTAC